MGLIKIDLNSKNVNTSPIHLPYIQGKCQTFHNTSFELQHFQNKYNVNLYLLKSIYLSNARVIF
jgi:hypothetical protein